MLKSMTGFGRFEAADSEHKITVEIKSVNHRYFEPAVKMPKKLNVYEAGIRTLLKDHISRGKVDVYISYEDFSENKFCVKYNEELAREYMQVFKQMAEQFHIENDIRVSALARFPEVVTMEEQAQGEDTLWHFIEHAVNEACLQFVETRIQEGEKLKDDMLGKLAYMTSLVDQIEERSPGLVEDYRNRLRDKVKELLGDSNMDESRIATEVTIYADKICVDEETVRLRSHIATTEETLKGGGSVGRKLDFIAQEMNREANTILSKANDMEVSGWAISLKTEIEKVREQIQNIE